MLFNWALAKKKKTTKIHGVPRHWDQKQTAFVEQEAYTNICPWETKRTQIKERRASRK